MGEESPAEKAPEEPAAAEAPAEELKVEPREKTVSDWVVEDVVSWLNGLNFEHCAPAFLSHKITGDMLFDLEKADFKAMGFVLGDMKRLEKAIATLKASDVGLKPSDVSPNAGKEPE